MKQIFYFLLCALLFAGCSNEIPEKKPLERSGRTVLAYLVANNRDGSRLDSYLKDNVVDMYEALLQSKDSCTLLVYYRPDVSDSEVEAPVLFEFLSDGEGHINGKTALLGGNLSFGRVFQEAHVIKEYTEANHSAVNPQVMSQVFKDMQNIAPSESYGLVFGSHASGWLPAKKTVNSKAFGDDAGYNVDIPDLADAVRSSFLEPLDFILFDACMMGTAEVCYELEDVTRYCIASVMETPAYGFPYDMLLLDLYANPVDFNAVCNKFIAFNKTEKQWGTCAAIDCTVMEELASAVKDELAQSAGLWESFDYRQVQQYGLSSYRYFSFDVADFFRQLYGGQVPSAIQSALDNAVVAKDCLPDGYYPVDEARFCGIGMYYPAIEKTWNDYYKTSVSWYKAVEWEAVIN